MVGIVAFGGYIPRPRLSRIAVAQSMGWLAPGLFAMAQGERSFCNWDEDSLTMSVAATRDCLTGVDKQTVDGLYLASTTHPFADRLNAGVVATALNLREDILAMDFGSTERAGTSAMIAALDAVCSGHVKRALVTAADRRETKAASNYEMWFGDGAASVLLGDGDVIAELEGTHTVSCDFVDHYRGAQHRFDYTWEERWVRDEGYGKIIPDAIRALLSKLGIPISDVSKLAYPCFFKQEHARIAKALGASPAQVVDNLHEACGDTGAAHPLVLLVRALEEAKPGDRIVVAGFGQGCDALCFRATDRIAALSPRRGIRGSLARGKTTENYLKFLEFRGLITIETGIRSEAPTQTAMSTLWRRRQTLTGMVGGKCIVCGTPQWPKMDICVNPNCGAVNTQIDYEFADIPARVKTFTGDMLAVSMDPPAIYGMVQFEGGGRFMADFTDCDLADVKVGQPVQMVFRRHHVDEKRGFTGYFWKAAPQVEAAVAKPQADTAPEAAQAPIRFDGRVAIITGAGSGLGRAYAIDLARRGARVLVNDLGGATDGTGQSTSAADSVVREIEQAGGVAAASYDSVATPEGGERIVKTALDRFGRVDILIHNAGILRDKTLAKMTLDMWNDVLAVHLHGAYNVTRPAFIAMQQGNYGRIVMCSSASGLFGNFGQTNYGAAKLGMVGLMNSLKLEGVKYNIQVNTVAPLAKTRLSAPTLPPGWLDKLTPELVTPLVLFLCSEACADTGMIFQAAGGFFNRCAIVSGPGVLVGDGVRPPTLEEIQENWARIRSIDGATEHADLTAAVMAIVAQPSGQPTGGGPIKPG